MAKQVDIYAKLRRAKKPLRLTHKEKKEDFDATYDKPTETIFVSSVDPQKRENNPGENIKPEMLKHYKIAPPPKSVTGFGVKLSQLPFFPDTVEVYKGGSNPIKACIKGLLVKLVESGYMVMIYPEQFTGYVSLKKLPVLHKEKDPKIVALNKSLDYTSDMEELERKIAKGFEEQVEKQVARHESHVPYQKCPVCEGTGYIDKVTCTVCEGAKIIPMHQT